MGRSSTGTVALHARSPKPRPGWAEASTPGTDAEEGEARTVLVGCGLRRGPSPHRSGAGSARAPRGRSDRSPRWPQARGPDLDWPLPYGSRWPCRSRSAAGASDGDLRRLFTDACGSSRLLWSVRGFVAELDAESLHQLLNVVVTIMIDELVEDRSLCESRRCYLLEPVIKT